MAQRKGPTAGTGGKGRKALAGRGPTPKAEERPHHPAAKRAAKATRRAATSQPPRGSRAAESASRTPGTVGSAGRSSGPSRGRAVGEEPQDELVTGRNAVTEALRAKVPATTLLVAVGIDADDRVTEAVRACA